MEQTMTYVKIMEESLERKKRYLEEILSLTREQEVLVKAEDFDDENFGKLVDKKEILIDNINEIDKGFASVYERVRSEVMGHQEEYRDVLLRMQDLIRSCVDIGVEVETLEERNRATLEQHFSNGYQGIRRVKQSMSIANKYYQSMSNGVVNDSILYDRKK